MKFVIHAVPYNYLSQVKDVNEHKGTYETINMSIPSTPNTNVSEQNDLKLN